MAKNQPPDQFTKYFVDMEHKWLKYWDEKKIVEKYLNKNNGADKKFSFQDGPITANNPMGVHHAWGRTYKDLWQKFNNLLGSEQRFHSGFDCQGLWVEVEVEKELGLKSKKDIENLVEGDPVASVAKFVQLCKDRVYKYSAIQTEQSKRLGYFMDWKNSYYTMDPDNNYMIWHFLKLCHENGWVYKGHESVPWCPRCETAISQHEMLTEDYKEVTHDSIYLELPVTDRENEYLLIWTTTPWTIPANIAVAADKKIEYAQVRGTTGDTYWLAKDRVEGVFGKDYKEIVKVVKGSELIGLRYKGPFDDLEAVSAVAEKNKKNFHVVVETDPLILPILTTEGTGLVHTAVSAGVEDFKLGKKLGLPMIPVIADNADYLPHMGYLAGKNAKKDPNIIFDLLKEKESKGENWIFFIDPYTHRYPGCWRCKAELVWKVADEWYIAMDVKSNLDPKNRTLRERMLKVANQIKWMPSFGLKREIDWLENMHDWLISKKNRYWGLALPIYECEDCKTFEVIGSESELKERAVSGWEQFEGKTPHKPYIDSVKISCSKCKKKMSRILDVGNPWLDAGIVPFSTIKNDNQGKPLFTQDYKKWLKWFPVDFITESFPGQFKNWFYAMIAMSTVIEDRNPFKRVLGFATLVGEDGRPMHKSWGNSIAFHEGADDIGVDVMRWMYVRQNPSENLAFGYGTANEVRRRFYLLIWNIYKFYKSNAEVDKTAFFDETPNTENLSTLDRWILMRLSQTVNVVKSSLIEFDAKNASVEIEEFVQDLSLWYIRRSRDRVGPTADPKDRENFYKTIQYIFSKFSIILSPFMPFLSEELFTDLTDEESVHLKSWPTIEIKIDENLIHDMKVLRKAVEVGHRVRKDAKIKVRQPLASIKISIPKSSALRIESNFESYKKLLEAELNVKQVEFGDGKLEILTEYDLVLTPELSHEGKLRDLLRKIQNKRKKNRMTMSEKVKLVIPEVFKANETLIKEQVMAKEISYGEVLMVEKAK